jgi:hypothetical protein
MLSLSTSRQTLSEVQQKRTKRVENARCCLPVRHLKRKIGCFAPQTIQAFMHLREKRFAVPDGLVRASERQLSAYRSQDASDFQQPRIYVSQPWQVVAVVVLVDFHEANQHSPRPIK